MQFLTHPPCTTIKQWEDAGVALIASLKDYTELCSAIKPQPLDNVMELSDFETRIDTTLEVISDQLLNVRLSLKRARNRLVPSFLRLPGEVASTIFMHFVFDRRPTIAEATECGRDISSRYGYLTAFQEVRLIYSRLRKLLCVCSSWKDALMTEGMFWTIIPCIQVQNSTKFKQAIKHVLPRAGGCKLSLVAGQFSLRNVYNISESLPELLTQYGLRLRAINLSTDNLRMIRDTVTNLPLVGATSVTEISIELNKGLRVAPRLPRDPDYIFPPSYPEQDSFTDTIGTLKAFRISGIYFHWDTMVFSGRLVELQIANITLGYDEAIIPFLHALSSAPGLRDLKIISVTTFRHEGVPFNQHALSNMSVEFPNLRSLLVQKLYFNTLECLLPMIKSVWDCLVLFLNYRCLRTKEEGDRQMRPPRVDRVTNLCKILSPLSLDALTLGHGHDEETWLDMITFQVLLKGLPTLTTLRMHNWIFEGGIWQGLTRPSVAESDSQAHSFAALENLYLNAARLRTCTFPLGDVQRMVASHPLRLVVLGGVRESAPPHAYQDSLLGTDVVTVFEKNVPEFRLVNQLEFLPEYYLDSWQLW
ncbi:unnamed protein product [Rhizoctonia solani]|uniref:Uncharacterized protein n=1 Tax=Rhizoctonia solani TaxID=456999 RepID=A0A8H3HNL4_9AGAM|nr:unnamed protein product [Rhizoctonia solani]